MHQEIQFLTDSFQFSINFGKLVYPTKMKTPNFTPLTPCSFSYNRNSKFKIIQICLYYITVNHFFGPYILGHLITLIYTNFVKNKLP